MDSVPARRRELRRSRSDRIIGGVCAGVANYFAVDPLLIRIVFVILALAQGAGLLLYVLLWLLVPEEGIEPSSGGDVIRAGIAGIQEDVGRVATHLRSSAPAAHREAGRLGALLVVLGAFLLALNVGWFWWWNWSIGAPLLLIVVGAALLVRRLR